MTKYTPITFTKLSEAIAYLEDGGELFMKRNSNHGYSESNICAVTRNDLCIYDFWKDSTLCTEAQPAQWYEKLDGTVENGVLCWVRDGNLVAGDSDDIAVITAYDFQFGDNSGSTWMQANPLTRAEIEQLIDNAPDEL